MGSPRPVAALTDDLLQEIFLRVGCPADLARASTACVAFRRLIADPSFLRRYRSLHSPILLGILDPDGFQPAEAPHPSAALARAVARAADFSFEDCLPRVAGACDWNLWDVRDGRFLFRCLREDVVEEVFFLDFAVCDPLARRCLLLPPIPDDLLAAVQFQKEDMEGIRLFLVPSGYEEDDTSFRVIARMELTETMLTFIFSSSAGHWSPGASVRWDALSIPLERRWLVASSYAYGCFYWKTVCENRWIKFDMSSMEFSAVDLPSGRDGYHVKNIVEAGEGRLGMFTLINKCTSLCYSVVRQIGGERFDQLKMDTIIPLPEGYSYHIHGSFEGHIFISGSRSLGGPHTCLALEIKTLKIERVCQMSCLLVYPYFGFPPSMSQRRI